MHHSKKKSAFKVSYIICFAIILILVVGIIIYGYEKRISDDKAMQVQDAAMNSRINELSSQAAEKLTNAKNYGVYYKIKNGQNINCLIVGDSIGASNCATSADNYWFNKLSGWFSNSQKVTATFKQICHPGAGISTGLAEYNADSGSGYDLIFICYGINDRGSGNDLSVFSKNYETLVKDIISKNSRSDIVLMIESSFDEDSGLTFAGNNENIPNVIKKIADYYNLSCADLSVSFKNLGVDYNSLSVDGTHPNDAGYDIYFKTLSNLINQNITNDKKINYTTKASLYN